jgi:hypothetical protein
MYGQVRVGERLLRKTLARVLKEGSKSLSFIEKCKKESKMEMGFEELLLEMQQRLQEYEDGLLVCEGGGRGKERIGVRRLW